MYLYVSGGNSIIYLLPIFNILIIFYSFYVSTIWWCSRHGNIGWWNCCPFPDYPLPPSLMTPPLLPFLKFRYTSYYYCVISWCFLGILNCNFLFSTIFVLIDSYVVIYIEDGGSGLLFWFQHNPTNGNDGARGIRMAPCFYNSLFLPRTDAIIG